jgi:hypothetical protein
MDILYLVDRLEELINDGWHIPFTTNVVMDEDEFLDIIDQMRVSIPEEVNQAKRIQQEKERLLSQAKEESDRLISLSRDEHQALISDHEILKAAEAQRQAILEEGRLEVRDMRKGADAYVIDVLSQLEDQLSGQLTTVHNGVTALRQQATQETNRELDFEEPDALPTDREIPPEQPDTEDPE